MNPNVTAFQRCPREEEILTTCDNFAQTVFNITRDLRMSASTDEILPNFPRAALLTMMKKEEQPRTVLREDELSRYLQSKITAIDMDVLPPPEQVPLNSLNDVVNSLYEGYRILKSVNAKVLRCSLIYGQWLQVAFNYVNNRTNGVNYSGNWENWLAKNNIGIKVSHARML